MSLSVTTEINNLLPLLHADSTANLVHWTDAQLTRWYHDQLIRHAQTTGAFVKRSQVITLVAGQATYPAPTDLLDVMHVAIDGIPLSPSTTTELEALDDGFRTTAATSTSLPSRWYTDKYGANLIGLYPVPAASAGAGSELDIIYHFYPCGLDAAHTNVTIAVPSPIGVLLDLRVLAEAFGCETDGQMPEVAKAASSIADLLNRSTVVYYGPSQ